MSRLRPQAAFLAALVVALPAHPIVMRHDRPSERYEKLAEPYAALVDLRLPGGAGTLVAPRWVLTAAHAVAGIEPGHRLGVGSAEARVAEVVPYPGGQVGRDDLALVRLAEPVTGLRPLPLYRGSSEAGTTMVFVGRGGSGDGLTGPIRRDRKLRAATNVVVRVGQKHLEFLFDPPGQGTDLEGISGPGDSGGPGLIAEGGEVFVAGVSSGQDSRAQGREGVYGVREVYTRVSAYLDWLDVTMAGTTALAAR